MLLSRITVMPILSALDCISPAIGRTKLVLFTPFRAGRTWKLAATSWLAGYGGVFLPLYLLFLAGTPLLRKQPGVSSVMISGIVGVMVVLTLIYLAVFALLSRLRFAAFDIVLNRGTHVAPVWKKYAGPALRWTLFKVLLGSGFTALAALPTIHISHGIFANIGSFKGQEPGAPPSPEMMQLIFSFYAAFFLVYLAVGLFYFVSSLLSDFVVPSLALEDTSLAEAFRRVGVLLRNEPGQVALYALLKFALFFVGAMAVGIVFYISLFVVVLVAVLVGGLIGLVLHLLHVPTAVLMALAGVFGVLIYLFFIFYAMGMATGTLFTCLESYTLYFLSGRYPMLGELLSVSTPPVEARDVLYPTPYPPYVPPPSN